MEIKILSDEQINKLDKREVDLAMADLRHISPDDADNLSDEVLTYICQIMARARVLGSNSGPPRKAKPADFTLDDIKSAF